LHLSDHFICHVRVTFRQVSTSVDCDAALIGGFHVQRTFRVERILTSGGILKLGYSLMNTGDT